MLRDRRDLCDVGALKGIFDLRRPASAGAGRLGEGCSGF